MSQGNLNPDQVFELFNKLQGKGRSEQQMQSDLSQMLLKRMAPEQSQRFQQVLKDKNAMEKLMQSDQAKQLMKRFRMDSEQK